MPNIIPTNHVHMRIYIKVPYFTFFRFPALSIVGLWIGLVVELVIIKHIALIIFDFSYLLMG